MKKNVLSIIAITVWFVATGCSDKENRCIIQNSDQEGSNALPDDCYDCQWYASESATLSDTGYNTVTAVRNRYTCHRETLKEHVGDTLQMVGWLYWGNIEAGEMIPDYMLGDIGDVCLTDREDHFGMHEVFVVMLNKKLKTKFQENYDAMLVKKWYVKGILQANDHQTGGCCALHPVLEAIEFDTIKN